MSIIDTLQYHTSSNSLRLDRGGYSNSLREEYRDNGIHGRTMWLSMITEMTKKLDSSKNELYKQLLTVFLYSGELSNQELLEISQKHGVNIWLVYEEARNIQNEAIVLLAKEKRAWAKKQENAAVNASQRRRNIA